MTVLTILGGNNVNWNSSTGGTWSTGSNWVGGTAPNTAGSSAYLGNTLLSGGTIAMPGNETVGSLSFDNTAASYTVGSGLTGGTLTLNNNGATPQIFDLSGTHVVNAPIALAGNTNLNVLVQSSTDSLALNSGVSGLTGTLQVFGSGSLSLYQPGASSSTTIGTVSGQAGSTVMLALDPTSSGTISSTLNSPGQTVKFNGGTWTLGFAGGFSSTVEVDSGSVTHPATVNDFNFVRGLTIHGGTLSVLNLYGLRMGGNGAGDTTGGVNFVGVQDGGLLFFSPANSGDSNMSLGSNTPNANASYSLTGGTYASQVISLITIISISAPPRRHGLDHVHSRRHRQTDLRAKHRNDPWQPGGWRGQNFNFLGGTLVVSSLDMTNLRHYR